MSVEPDGAAIGFAPPAAGASEGNEAGPLPGSAAALVPGRLSFAAYQAMTLSSLIVGYMGYYLCRANFSAAHDALRSGVGMTDLTFGNLATAGTAAYALGKVAFGPSTDRYGGRRLFFIGLFGSVAASIGFGVTGALPALFLFCILNRAFQSLGWGGLMSVLSRWVTPARYGTASGALSASYQVGGVTAGLFASALIGLGVGWRGLFLWPAAALGVLGLVLLVTLKGSPRDVGYEIPSETGHKVSEPPVPPLRQRLAQLMTNPSFLIACQLSFVLTFIREVFNTWLPAYFSQQGDSSEKSVLESILFPALGCVGTLIAGWVSDRFFKRNRGPILAVFLTGAAAVLYALGHADTLGLVVEHALGITRGPFLATLVALTGFFILAPYSMVGGGVLALDAGGRQSAATAVGILDGIGYTGGMLAGTGIALFLGSKGNWQPVFNAMTWSVLFSVGLCVVLTVMTQRRAALE